MKKDEFASNSKTLILEEFCEKYFKETTSRDDNDRFIVKYPFKDDSKNIGDSYEIARERFNLLEKRLDRDIDLKLNI